MPKFTSMLLFCTLFLCQNTTTFGEENEKSELKKLEGTWILKTMTINGQTKTMNDDQSRFRFEGNKFFNTRKLNKVKTQTMEGTFKIDDQTKPKRLTLVLGNSKKRTTNGIYEIDGETLKFRISTKKSEKPIWPKEIKTNEPNTLLYTFKKKKK